MNLALIDVSNDKAGLEKKAANLEVQCIYAEVRYWGSVIKWGLWIDEEYTDESLAKHKKDCEGE